MTRLANPTLDDAVAAAERASGKKLNQPNRHIVLNRARAQIESQRHTDPSAGGFCLVTSACTASVNATAELFVPRRSERKEKMEPSGS